MGKGKEMGVAPTLRSLRTKMLIPELFGKILNQAMLLETGKMLHGQSEKGIATEQ